MAVFLFIKNILQICLLLVNIKLLYGAQRRSRVDKKIREAWRMTENQVPAIKLE
jgi:hypothetical protein